MHKGYCGAEIEEKVSLSDPPYYCVRCTCGRSEGSRELFDSLELCKGCPENIDYFSD